MPRREWGQANAKLDAEAFCRACGKPYPERAHIVGRVHDFAPPVRGDWWPGVVAADRIIPLCGPPTDTGSCHGRHHRKDLDLLPILTLAEQVQAVADAGSIATAHELLMPSESAKRVLR